MAGASASGYRGALGHRDYRLLMGRYVISGIGSWAYVVALIAFVWDQTGSAAWVAAVSICRLAPMFIFSTYAGVLAERFERTRVVLASDLGALVCMMGLVAVALAEAPVWVALAFAAVTSVATIMEEPAVAALVPQVVGEDDLAAANGLFGVIANLNVIAGPAVGATVLALTSPAGTFAVNAGTFAVAAVLVTMLEVRSTPTDVTDDGEAGMLTQLMVGARAIAEDRRAAILVAFGTVASFIYGLDTVVFPVLGERLGLGANGFGVLLTGLGVGGVLAGLGVSRVSKQARLATTMALSLLLVSAPTAVLAFVDNSTLAFSLQVVRGAAILVVDVLAMTALQRSLPPYLISRVMGSLLSLAIGAMVAGAVVAPILLELLGLDGTLLLVGIGIPAVVVVAAPWWSPMDRDAVAQLAAIQPRVELLESLGIFAQAPRPVIERLARAAGDLVLAPGTAVVREGDPADALYVVVTGELEVTAIDPAGAERRLSTMSAPGYFGEIGLLEQIPRTATVTTTTETTLYRIDGDTFHDALTAAPASPAFAESARLRRARTAETVAVTSAGSEAPA
jgi:MFS family permease